MVIFYSKLFVYQRVYLGKISNSPTWIKAIKGDDFPIIISSEGEQWGRYNLPGIWCYNPSILHLWLSWGDAYGYAASLEGVYMYLKKTKTCLRQRNPQDSVATVWTLRRNQGAVDATSPAVQIAAPAEPSWP